MKSKGQGWRSKFIRSTFLAFWKLVLNRYFQILNYLTLLSYFLLYSRIPLSYLQSFISPGSLILLNFRSVFSNIFFGSPQIWKKIFENHFFGLAFGRDFNTLFKSYINMIVNLWSIDGFYFGYFSFYGFLLIYNIRLFKLSSPLLKILHKISIRNKYYSRLLPRVYSKKSWLIYEI